MASMRDLESNSVSEIDQKQLKEMEKSHFFFKIFKIHHCEVCDGTNIDLMTGKCNTCGCFNQIDKDALQKFNEFILKFKDIQIQLTPENSHYLLKFYQLSKRQHLPFLDEFILSNHIEEQFIEMINQKIQQEVVLSSDEDQLLDMLISSSKGNGEKILIDGIFRDIFLGKQVVTFSTFQKILQYFVKGTMKILNDGRIPNYFPSCSVDSLRKNKLGSSSYRNLGECTFNQVTLSLESVQKIYQGEVKEFQTIFHELCHVKDSLDIYSNVFNRQLMVKIKDFAVRELSYQKELLKGENFDRYYHDNYLNLSFEIDAEADGYIYFMRYLTYLGLKLSEKQEQQLLTEISSFLVNRKSEREVSNLSYIDREKIELSELLDYLIEDSPQIFESYPQLKLEYIIEDNRVRPKNSKELFETYKALSKDDIYFKEKQSYLYDLMERKLEEESQKNIRK